MVKAIREGLNVLRYHTRTRIRPETNGHHSANVAALCLALEPECSKEVLVRAIMHDVPEAYTGDIPYPFKAESSKVKASLQQAEMVYIDQIGLPHPDITQSRHARPCAVLRGGAGHGEYYTGRSNRAGS